MRLKYIASMEGDAICIGLSMKSWNAWQGVQQHPLRDSTGIDRPGECVQNAIRIGVMVEKLIAHNIAGTLVHPADDPRPEHSTAFVLRPEVKDVVIRAPYLISADRAVIKLDIWLAFIGKGFLPLAA